MKNCTSGTRQYLIDPFGIYGAEIIAEVNTLFQNVIRCIRMYLKIMHTYSYLLIWNIAIMSVYVGARGGGGGHSVSQPPPPPPPPHTYIILTKVDGSDISLFHSVYSYTEAYVLEVVKHTYTL